MEQDVFRQCSGSCLSCVTVSENSTWYIRSAHLTPIASVLAFVNESKSFNSHIYDKAQAGYIRHSINWIAIEPQTNISDDWPPRLAGCHFLDWWLNTFPVVQAWVAFKML
jgi:hypothetical protein